MSNSELTHRVEALIEEVNNTHRYSMSRIYGLYNEVFGKNESPQSCASCLIRKIKELQTWLDSSPKTVESAEIEEEEATEKVEQIEVKPKVTTRKKRKNGSTEA